MKVHVLGYYDMQNVGDEAFRPAIADIFSGHDVEFFYADAYRVSPPPTPDAVVLGGGDVVTPYYLPIVSSVPCKIKIGLGVGLGYESESICAAEAGFSAWFVRNRADVDLIRSHVVVPVEYTPDLAFHLRPSGQKVLHRYLDTKQPVVAVLLTDYLMPSNVRSDEIFWTRSRLFLERFGEFCIELGKRGFKVIALPCSGDAHADDCRIHLSLRAFANNVVCVNDLLSPQEMIDLLSEVDYTICQRFHSHVFAMIAGKPILSVSFTRKVDKLLEAAGAGTRANCFDEGKYVDVNLMSKFMQMEKEANIQKSSFLQFDLSNKELLLAVKQKVLQLIR